MLNGRRPHVSVAGFVVPRAVYALAMALFAIVGLGSLNVAGFDASAEAGKPVDGTPASISGVVREGLTLTAGTGIWSGTAPLSYKYQWERCSALGGSCSNVSGATGSTYLLSSADVGSTLRVAATATNSEGSATSTSEATAIVAALGPVYASQFGSEGTGSGQFKHPGDVAIDSKGNLWVLDEGNDRVEEFNGQGEYQKAFGSAGSGNGELSSPDGLAVDAKGNVWVVDSGNDRVEEFNEKGEYEKVFGSAGSGNGQFSTPEGIAVDAHGNIWVSDTYHGRLEEFNEKGEYLKTAGSEGSGAGQLGEPEGLAVDSKGNVWVADWTNKRVAEFNEKGEYVKEFGSSGSGNGQFGSPYGIVVDSNGNVWVADNGNDRLDEFNEKGEYDGALGSKGTGAGQLSFSWPIGVAIDSKGDLWVTDSSNNRVEKWIVPGYPSYYSEFGSEGTGSGQFKHPGDVAVDSKGNLWVLDEGNDRVEEFNEKGEYSKAFGSKGSGSGQLDEPDALAVDSGGNVWIADGGNHRVEEFNEKGEYEKSFGSEGSSSGEFGGSGPEGIAVDSSGDVWVSDTYNGRLEEFNDKGEYMKTVGSKGSGAGELGEPEDLAIDSKGNVWVADWSNDRVEEFNEKGEYVREFGTEGSGNGEVEDPYGITVDSNGDVWVGDTGNDRVDEFNKEGKYVGTFGSKGSGPGQLGFRYPIGLAVDSKGDLWVTDPEYNHVEKWIVPGYPSYSSEFGSEGSGSGQFKHPGDVAVDAKGNLWVLDEGNDRVEEFNGQGEYQKAFGSAGSGSGELSSPDGLAVDAKGNVWVVDSGNDRVEEFNEKGEYEKVFGSAGSGNGQFSTPEGIAVDSHGDVWVSDTYNGRLEKFNEKGEYIKTVGSEGSGAGQIGESEGLAIDSKGNVWVADWRNDRVEEFNENGEYLREFGSAGSGNGDMEDPYGIAVDSNGDVWVGDTGNDRVDEFNEKGEYVGTFGSKGSGPGQLGFRYPIGLAVDSKGDLWVTDPEYNHVEKWITPGYPSYPPSNAVHPSISGSLAIGQTLKAGTGAWFAMPSPTYAYQWQRCNAEGASCTNISGSTSSTYVVSDSDGGNTLRVIVVATNVAGSVESISAATSVMGAAGPVNTALPAISGTAEEGQVFSASTGSWEGTPPISYTYQWELCNSAGESCSNISGATSASYTLVHGDVGKTLRIAVTATNSAGSATATSKASGVVVAFTPTDTAEPVISGTEREGDQLSASTGSWEGTPPISYAYQWELCNSAGESCSNISGATSSTYTLGHSDVGKTLRMVVTATNADGSANASSEPSAVVVGPPVDVSAPIISGTARDGQTLSASTGTWEGTPTISYTYQWQSCNSSGEACTNISGATGSTYVLGHSDVGTTLRVIVTATNSEGSAESKSEASSVVAALAPSNTVLPAITGTAEVGQTLSASTGEWEGTPPLTYAYQWQSCNALGEACLNVSGATASTFVPAAEDVGDTLRVVVTAKNTAGASNATSKQTSEVLATLPSNTKAPAISGTAEDGQTLNASTGEWTGTPPLTYSYQWELCNAAGEHCEDISGATSASYTLSHGDVGNTVRVTVQASNARGTASSSSNPTGVVVAAAPSNTTLPSISGTAKDGQTLTASTGSWEGTPTISYAYQWERCNTEGKECNAVTGATSASYTLGHGDVGSALRMVVTASNAGGSTPATSEASAAVEALAPSNTALPSISGAAEEGQTLTASNGEWNGTPPLTYTYQWQSCNALGEACLNISGATASTYVPAAEDVGDTLRVVVTAKNAAGSSGATSHQTSEVLATLPSNTKAPAISGTAEDGQTLTASTGEWAGTPTISYTYQWELCNAAGEHCEDMTGATSSSYTLGHSDVGSTVRVTVTATNKRGSVSTGSSVSGVVAAAPPSNTALPSISGTAKDGQTLTASTGEWAGTPTISYTYQWELCNAAGEHCEDISGATSSSYLLGHGDVGSTLRMVVMASNAGGSTPATSEASAVVEALAPSNTAPPAISGTAEVGQTLSASEGEWEGTPPLTYTYQWESCNALGEGCLDISGATASTYVPTAEVVGGTLTAVVTAKNTAGSGNATSSPTSEVLAVLPSNTKAPAISGTAEDGQTLSASTGEWTGTPPLTYAYQWERCNATGGECEEIVGATSSNYTLADGDVGGSARVTVTATNVRGSASAVSAASSRVAPVAPVNSGLPSIEGSAVEGQTLSVSPGEWSGEPAPSYTFQWERCNSGGGACADIEGATGTTYQLGAVDVGDTLRVRVVATNAASSATASSPATAAVASTGAVAPANTELPTISGSPEDGQTLSVDTGAWEGTAPLSYAYQWESCDEDGSSCEAIAGATGATYTLAPTDEQTRLRVIVTASGSGGHAQAVSEASAIVQVGAPSELEAPSISGSPSVGEALFAEVGAWNGSEVQFSYQWERCDEGGGECQPIPGADEPEYAPDGGDVDSSLRLRLGASNAEGSVTALSQASSPVQPSDVLLNTAAPSISGAAVSGGTLTANIGGWLGSETTISYAYEWESCDLYGAECETIEGATESTYSPAAGDVGRTLRVRVSASEVEGAVSELSGATAPVEAAGAPLPEAVPSITGTGLAGDTLTAMAGSWSGDEAIDYSYQWVRCNEESEACAPISGATEDAYTLSEEDAGFEVRALVTAGDLGGTSEAVSAPIIASARGIADVAPPQVSGSDQLGRPLQGGTGIWTGSGAIAFAYEWQRCTEAGESCEAIPAATASSYSPTEADAGHTLRVKVTATGLEGPASETSPVTPPIGSEATTPENTALPAIEGNLTAGDTLRANAGSWSGSEPIAHTYQWQRCNQLGSACVEIEGASGDTYTLTETDIGSRIRVLVGASNSAGSESATSEASEEVGAAGPPVNTQEPHVTGRAVEGQRLMAENGDWSGSKPFTYYYRWERCDTAGESCTAITGANKPSYTLAAADVGATVRVNVTAVNGLGSSGSISPQTEAVASATQAGTAAALEAIEATDPSLLARSTSASIEEQSLTPAIVDSGEEITSQSTLASSTISKATPGEFSLETAAGLLGLTPVKLSLSADTMPTIANGTAALFAETWHESDTIVRPSALGAITLLQLRSEHAPTSESWEVDLGARQQLERLSNGSVAIIEPTPEASLESPPGEEGPAPGSAEAPAQEEGEGFGAHGGEEELNGSLAEEGGLSPLPDAPTISPSEVEPKEHELHPQDTRERYEHDKSAMSYAEERTKDTALMVIEAPTVIDAAGHTVPATLAVEGDTVTLTISPEPEASYPITAEIATAAPTDLVSIARDPVEYGLSDPKEEVFEHLNSGLTKAPLNIKVARDVVPFYAWRTEPYKEDLRKWLKAVGKHKNIQPYITLRAKERTEINYNEYKEDVSELFKELMNGKEAEGIPAVKMWGALNEPDLPPSPLTAKPEKAAILWKIAESVGIELHCGCRVAAGEFHVWDEYIPRYIDTILYNNSYTSTKPNVWGFHDYYDPEQLQRHTEEHKGNIDLEKFLRAIKGRLSPSKIWISETGVLLQNGSASTDLYKHAKLQINAANDVLKLADGHSRVELVDYYLYEGPTKAYKEKHGKHSFDSALKAGDEVVEEQVPREAYCVLVEDKHKGCPAKGHTGRPAKGGVKASAATVTASVDPVGLPTTYVFEYGKTAAYGQSTTLTSLPSETGEQTTTAAIGGLEPCTTYHYQVEAENEANEEAPSLGGDQTFKTWCIAAVAVGNGHRCQLLVDGHVECWGENAGGQLGDGTTESSSTPVPVSGITSAMAITAATNYSCAALAEGSVYCWGENYAGQLGDGGEESSSVPVRVSGVSDAVDVVAAGRVHACAVGSEGETECWGANEVGQAPRLEEGLSGTAIGAGGGVAFTCALLATGRVECWGENYEGNLGDGTKEDSAEPVQVSGITTATSVTADGEGFACASLESGAVKCWGRGYGLTPVQVSGVADAVAVAGGEGFACALRGTGQVECWSYRGDLAVEPIAGITDATAIGASGEEACAVIAGETVECWPEEEEHGPPPE